MNREQRAALLAEEMKAFQALFEPYLEGLLPGEGLEQQTVADAMRYSLLAGGKRIRPFLLVSCHKLCGGEPGQVLPLAAALEMIHTYSLIHDDLPCMDNDDYRRGRPTSHKVFGEAMAVLAGDGLLTAAFETALQARVEPALLCKAVQELGRAAGLFGMLGGQSIDVESEKKRLSLDEAQMLRMYAMKTGALLTGATLYGGRIKGIRRGALAPVMPCANGQVMLCDAGANTECTAEMLLQFAFLASLYAEKINGVVKPRVGLVNNGTEDTKGDPLRKEAYALLKKAGDEGRLNFVGNVEGSMVPLGACDVAVCDGFTGNVQLKTIEGVAKFMSKEIKGVFMASVGTKLGYLLCKKGMDDFREVFNQDKIGGAPFLGIAKPVIKAHGSSNEIAVMNAVRRAIAYTKSGMIDAVKENIQYMTVE